MTNTGPAPQSAPGPARTDAIIEAMMNARRRRMLFHLRQHGTSTVDELVTAIETDTVVGFPQIVELARAHLYHQDIPKLEYLRVVAYDSETDSVTLVAASQELDEWLDLAIHNDYRTEFVQAKRVDTDATEKRVLIVDDDEGLLELVESYLQSRYDGLSVTTASDVEQAVRTLHTEPFDCIVSDLQMPALSGLDFLKVIRKDNPDIPFLLYTARGSERVASEAVENNVAGYVLKSHDPNQFADLARQIRRAVGIVSESIE